MAQVGRVHANLVLAPRLKPELHQRVLGGAVQHVEVGDGQLAAIVHGRGVCDVSLVVLQPTAQRAFVILHLAAHHGHVAAVVDQLVPRVFQYLLGVHILGIDHQAAGVAVKAVHHVGGAFLSRLAEIVVEHRLHVQRRVSAGHREDARLFLNHNEPAVFVDNLDVAALEALLVAL